MLERIPSRFQVIRHVRVKLACACCERIVQAAAPSRPIERGVAGPGLLAHVLVSKYGDHLPLYRQSEIYAREGVELDRSTLADWVGGTSRLFDPLLEALRRHVMSAQKLHADDTPVPVLAPAWEDKNRTIVDVCTRRSASGRPDATGGVVRLLSRSQGGTSQSAPEPIQGNAAGGCLRGLRSDL